MNYTPITVTADNLEWAVRENTRRIFAALRTKVHTTMIRPVSGIDADGAIMSGFRYDLDIPTSGLTVDGAVALLEELNG